MKYFLLVLSLLAFSFTTDKDCRNFNFGDSPENVRANESALFVKEEMLNHNLKGLTFAEHKADAIVLYTYTFHLNKLNGLKMKKLSPTGDNSYMNAYNNYKEALAKYSANCDLKIKETVGDKGLRTFHFTSDQRKVYVMMQQENQDFFMVENIFKK